MAIMVTGGAGYIGSHAVQRLLRNGHEVVALDNLFRGHREAIDAINHAAGGGATLVEGDIGDRTLVEKTLKEFDVDTVMHFAAISYVGESVDQPLLYYRNNAAGALSLLEACDACGVERFIFSSTCATYGEPAEQFIPIPEVCPQAPINPYGRSKLQVEQILFDYAHTCRSQGRPFAFAALRYFNVAGSDRSGVIGEHHVPETHLIPIILQAILGQRESVTVFGNDYPTPDGTCIRDYLHVEDLIDAHVRVMEALEPGSELVFNLGIGKGYSVMEIIEAAKRATGADLDVRMGQRRPGDPPMLYADPSKIHSELGWKAHITDIEEIIGSAWAWFQANPHGYIPGALAKNAPTETTPG